MFQEYNLFGEFSATIKPFIKWPGGKRSIISKILDHFPENFNNFFESFVGGGAVFINAKPSVATINDSNKQLINCYCQIKDNPKELVDFIKTFERLEFSKELFLNLRERFNSHISEGVLNSETAALMIWLNKHCFNGLYRTNSKGLFNVSCNDRSGNTFVNVENIFNLSEFFNNCDLKIFSKDFEEVCRNVKTGDLVYLDPPYFPISGSNFVSYGKDRFTLEDNVRLAEMCKKITDIGAFFILSNNDCEEIREFYKDFEIRTLQVNRPIGGGSRVKKVSEVLVKNF